MTIKNLFGTTDNPARLQPLRTCSTPEEARIAARDAVRTHCGDCGQSWRGHNLPAHECRNPVTGNDLGPAKRARAEAARRELQALRNFAPSPPCRDCGASMLSGVWHECEQATEALPHDRAAAAWQRQGAATLAAELAEVTKKPAAS